MDSWCLVRATAWCAQDFNGFVMFSSPCVLVQCVFQEPSLVVSQDGTPTCLGKDSGLAEVSGDVFPESGNGTSTQCGTAGAQDLATLGTGAVVTGGTQCTAEPGSSLRSALGEGFHSIPQIIPVRANLDSVKALMKGDCYKGRGCRQRGLLRSRFANTYKVAQFGREQAIWLFSRDLETDVQLRSSLCILSGLRRICHCTERQSCHADKLIAAHMEDCPAAFDRHEWEPPLIQ